MAARVLRMFELYNPDLGATTNRSDRTSASTGRSRAGASGSPRSASLMYFLLLPFAVAGGVMLCRRRIPVSPLLAMPIVITITTAFTFGITRYRVPVDVMLSSSLAAAIDAILRRWWPTRRTPDLSRLRRRAQDAEPDHVPSPPTLRTRSPIRA